MKRSSLFALTKPTFQPEETSALPVGETRAAETATKPATALAGWFMAWDEMFYYCCAIVMSSRATCHRAF